MKRQQIHIVTWNINQRSGYYNRNVEIPNLVIAELIRQNADVIVLTEYKHCKSFEDILCGIGYFVSTNDKNPKGNEILIAIKNDCLNDTKPVRLYPNSIDNNMPDFLRVDATLYERPVTIIGTRIRTTEERNRKAQLDYILKADYIKNKNVIIAGDFNIGEYKDKDWNYATIKETILSEKLEIYPDIKGKTLDYSWKSENYEKGFAQDRIISSSSFTVMPIYSWDFRKLKPSIYKNENGHDVYDQYPPYPDHAILSANIELPTENQ